MKTLITFLGKGREDKKTGYRETTYRFPDEFTKKTAFFGLALAEYIKPSRIVILGTCSSQWDVLVENLATEGEEEKARVELMDAGIQVQQEHLNNTVALMNRSVCDLIATKCEIIPRLIPFGINESQQYEILERVAGNVSEGTVDFDLTHGFRHFGMIGFLSAFMLEHIRALNVTGLWYGALEMTQDGITPVLKLDGLDRVQRWVNALSRFDATGNYAEFVELLMEDGVPEDKARCLRDAAFHERTLNLSDSARKISTFLPVLDTQLQGASGLFQQKLSERLAWARPQSRATQQAKLAQQYLDRGDYLRAAIFAWEALITHECERNGEDPNKRGARERHGNVHNALTHWPIKPGKTRTDNQTAYKNLNQIRNALAHSGQPVLEKIQHAFQNEQQLRQTLQDAFNCLLPL